MNEMSKTDVIAESNATKENNRMFHILKTIFWEEVKSRVPVLGAIESLKKEKLGLAEGNRLNKLLNIMNNKMIELEDNKIDYNFIKTEEFARIAFTTFDKARIDYREEKLKYYANLLVNYSTIKFSNDFYKEGIIEKIGMYSVEHILTFNSIYYLCRKQVERRKNIHINSAIKFDIKNIYMTGEDVEITSVCFNDLLKDGFIDSYTSASDDNYRLTEYGLRLYSIINESA